MLELLFTREAFSFFENAADENVDGKTKLMEINNKHLAMRGAFFFKLILHESRCKSKQKAQSVKPKTFVIINY